MPLPIQGLGDVWGFIKSKLQEEGSLNKAYDSDLDGVIDWKVLQFFGVRQEILAKFTDPKLLIATSSMLALLNSADKAGSNTGGISATSQELTITGGTSTASGSTWIYFELPDPASKVYTIAKLNSVNCQDIDIDYFYGDPTTSPGSTSDYRYSAYIVVPASASDFKVCKVVGGTTTVLASESVDLSNNTYYTVEFYCDVNNEILAYRDGVLKFNVSPDPTNIPEIDAVRLRVFDISTTTAQSGKFKGIVVIIYE